MLEIILTCFTPSPWRAALFWLGNVLCKKVVIFNKYCIPARWSAAYAFHCQHADVRSRRRLHIV